MMSAGGCVRHDGGDRGCGEVVKGGVNDEMWVRVAGEATSR